MIVQILRLSVFILLAFLAGEAAAGTDRCAAADDVAGTAEPLPNVAAMLAPGKVLNILTVGSATVFSPEASLAPGTVTSQALGLSQAAPAPAGPVQTSERAFPSQMAKALQAAAPGADVRVTVRGGRGLTAAEMLGVLRTELAAHRYQLVIWQTGTVEAVRNLPPSDFAMVLAEGAELAQAAGADLVLVDPQYSRFLQTNANLDPYEQALQQASALPGVMLFRRYDLMRSWANEGQIDLERTSRADRQRTIETLHQCLGSHLAKLILSAARS